MSEASKYKLPTFAQMQKRIAEERKNETLKEQLNRLAKEYSFNIFNKHP